jgi:hypothetical protein
VWEGLRGVGEAVCAVEVGAVCEGLGRVGEALCAVEPRGG